MYRLIYKSKSNNVITWDQVKEIMHSSEVQNSELGVSGVLLATSSHYLQVLEGPYETANEIFMRIVKDPRHTDIRLVSFNTIDARIFEAWGMLGIGVFNLNKQLEAELKEKYGMEDDGLKFPLDEWKALAMMNDINLVSEQPEWKM
jgi:hypothetical protein